MAYSARATRAASHAQVRRIGHTCAWTVTRHLDRQTFAQLKRFCGTDPSLSASIARKQLEMAVRQAAEDTGRRLKLARYDVLDMSDEAADAHPVVARVDASYALSQNLFAAWHTDTYRRLTERYREVQDTVHTTIACGVIKRFVRRTLRGLSLRDHGGVFFVSEKAEDRLFALSDFLKQSGIGHITRITVGNGAAEKALIAGEIERIVAKQIEGLREAFGASDLIDPASRERLRDKVAATRHEIARMQDLFAFAKRTLDEKDRQARALMVRVLRGERTLPETLFPDENAPSGENAFSGSRPDRDVDGDGGDSASGDKLPAFARPAIAGGGLSVGA